MPTNLPAEAKEKLARYQMAKTLEEKIEALEEAISYIPKHKHTEKMLRQLKKRLAELRRELERKTSKTVGRKDDFNVKKEGVAQVVILGMTNSGKSSLLKMLTNATPEVADYPMTTTKPIPGMMVYEDVEIQLVELPAILSMDFEETSIAYRSISFARNADLIVLLLDPLNDPFNQLKKMVEMLEEEDILLKRTNVQVTLERTDSGGIRIVTFGSLKCSFDDIVDLLQSIGIRNAVLKVVGDASIDDIEEQIIRGVVYKKGIAVLNKVDLVKDVPRELEELVMELGIPFVKVSAKDCYGLDELKKVIFDSLCLIRVYTQKDGIIAKKPIVVPAGTTVGQLAKMIHKELYEKFKFAKIWGTSVKIQGQRVGLMHVLNDKDIVEIFT